MRQLIYVALIGGSLLMPSTVWGGSDAWDEALESVGLTKQTCRFDPSFFDQFGGAEFRLSYATWVHHDPLQIPLVTTILRKDLLDISSKRTPSKLLDVAGARLGFGPRRTLVLDPLEEIAKKAALPNAFAKAIESIHETFGRKLDAKAKEVLRLKVRTVPPAVQTQGALLLLTSLATREWRNLAFRKVSAPTLKVAFEKLSRREWGIDDKPMDPRYWATLHDVDANWLLVGAADLLLAAERAVVALEKVTVEKYLFSWDTPFGRIAINGSQADLYPKVPYLLILDAGGDDTYFGGGATFDSTHFASVLIDLAGNDRYLADPALREKTVAAWEGRKTLKAVPHFGAGILGYGILIDVFGDDLYRAGHHALGRGDFGLGILDDRAGNDTYDCYTLCEGSAEVGVGILNDGEGKDTYLSFQKSQGHGGVLGFGMLVDGRREGDRYEANTKLIDFPAAGNKDHNESISQGVAAGFRNDYVDAHSLSGGIGVLVDGGGNNSFVLDWAGQGNAYWYGFGLLSVGDGNDTYQSVKYTQGAGVHFGTGVLHDTGGDDAYHVDWELGLGAGHDLGVGFVLDEAGNDTYLAANLSLGAAVVNGFGFFWDRTGDDTYKLTEGKVTLGATESRVPIPSLRTQHPTVGLFLDTAGTNTYSTLVSAKPHSRWRGSEDIRWLLGVGLDTDAPKTGLPK